MLDELTLGSCFFNTPRLVMPFLQSYVKFHKKYKPLNIHIMENSTDLDCSENFISNGISITKNSKMTHHESVNLLLDIVKTKYLLLVDSDILFKNDIYPIFKQFVESGSTIGGVIQGSRGGFELYDRVVPWFTFINLENIKLKNIHFYIPEKHDFHSEWNEPNRIALRQGKKCYDVGAEFLESVIENGFRIWEMSELKADNYYKHFEGMSWRHIDKDVMFRSMAIKVQNEYDKYCRANNLSSVNIKGAFK